MPANPDTGSLAASLAVNTRWARASQSERREQNEKMLAGQDRRYARDALDPHRKLTDDQFDALLVATPAAELAARIANARKAHMLKASLAAAKARKKVR
jgi:hypothetical protein